MRVSVDGQQERDALAALSDVVVDLSASTGTGELRYAVDFGDGTAPVATVRSHHSYQTEGTYTVVASVSDGSARRATAMQIVSVKALSGSWFHAGWNDRAHKFERRLLVITDQDGLDVRGFYGVTSTPDHRFRGSLGPGRQLHGTADGAESLEGTLPDRVGADTPWLLQTHGGSLDGGSLPFRFIPGAPTSPPPDAVLTIRGSSHGDEVAFAELSQTQYDASASRGDGLSFVMELPDGQVATSSQVVHAFQGDRAEFPYTEFMPRLEAGRIVKGFCLGICTKDARVWVVDRFGRVDSETIPIPYYPAKTTYLYWSGVGIGRIVKLVFQGPTWSGFQGYIRYATGFDFAFSGTVSDESVVQFRVDETGEEYRGRFEFPSKTPVGYFAYGGRLTLTQTAGPFAGEVQVLRFIDGSP